MNINIRNINNAKDFLQFIFDGNDKFYISTINEEMGWTNNFYTNLYNIDKMLSYCDKKNIDSHIYYSVSTYKLKEEEKVKYKNELQWKNNGRRKNNVENIKLIFFDFDELETVEQKLSDVKQLLGEPSVLVESSTGKRQAIYKLEESVSGEKKEDFENLMYILNDKIGSDVAVKTVQQILRLPFYKNIKKKYSINGEFPTSKIISSSFNKLNYDSLVETYKEDMKNISKLKLEKSSQRSSLSKNFNNRISMTEKRELESLDNLEVLDSNFNKYKQILKTTKSFKNSDLRYTKHMSERQEDFYVIFNEIELFREKLENPFSNTTMNTSEKLRKHFNTLLNIFIDNRQEKNLNLDKFIEVVGGVEEWKNINTSTTSEKIQEEFLNTSIMSDKMLEWENNRKSIVSLGHKKNTHFDIYNKHKSNQNHSLDLNKVYELKNITNSTKINEKNEEKENTFKHLTPFD